MALMYSRFRPLSLKSVSIWPVGQRRNTWPHGWGTAQTNEVTGGRIKGTRSKKVVNRAPCAFRMTAQAAGKSHSSLGT
jgi:hypothetical protein